MRKARAAKPASLIAKPAGLILFSLLFLFACAQTSATRLSSAAEAQANGDYALAETLWLEQAEAENCFVAQHNLGSLYFHGHLGKRDFVKAAEWWQRAVDQDYAPAMYDLANMYYYGYDVPQSFEKSFPLHKRAADKGYAPAQNILATYYELGEIVYKDEYQAVALYRQAAEQGDAAGQYNMGRKYQNINDNVHAVEWYYKAATQGEMRAQYALGDIYLGADGVNRNEGLAIQYFSLAAEQGFPPAQRSLGAMYYNGEGMPKNAQKAKELFASAAQRNDARAQYYLGIMLEEEEAYKDAAVWYEIAALNNLIPAQTKLRYLYYNLGNKALGCAWAYVSGVQEDVAACDSALSKEERAQAFNYVDAINKRITK
ncbi:MAG: sel1 repeat family protein [Deferribacteraceae bacterium]|jgi:TPR repeat protein|nr:sel1 repeat family protein [Deferribacteraceae bacterium]